MDNEPHTVHCITQIEDVAPHEHHHHHHHHQTRPRAHSNAHSHKDYLHLENPAMLLEPSGDLSMLSDSQPRKRHDDPGEMRDINVNRPVFSLPDFEEANEPSATTKTCKERMQSLVRNIDCSEKSWKKRAKRMVPFVKYMSTYDFKRYLLVDFISGLTIGIIALPQSLGYALLAGVPPVYGLYASFLPVLLYCLFGTSRNMCYGTLSITYLLVGNVVVQVSQQIREASGTTSAPTTIASTAVPTSSSVSQSSISAVSSTSASSAASTTTASNIYYNGDSLEASIGICLAFFMGVVQLLIGITRLGFITIYFADSMVAGYTTATIMYVFTSQLSALFGLKLKRQIGYFNLIKTWIMVFSNITSTNIATLIVTLVSVFALSVFKFWINPIVMKKIRAPIPVELLVIIAGIVVSGQMQLHENYNVIVVGNLPLGLPSPGIPDMSLAGQLFGNAIVLSLVNFAVSVSLAQVLAKKHGYEIDDNQEAIAYGLSNLISSFFHSIPTGGSVARTCVVESIKGQSQLLNLIASVIILIVLYTIAGLCSVLPNAVLASIIIVGLSGMIDQFKHVKILWKISKFDCCIWIVSFLSTVILDTDIGLVISILFSFLVVVVRTQMTRRSMLGNIPDTEIYENVKKFKNAKEDDEIKIFRFAGPINFSCATLFRSALYKKTGANPRKLQVERNKLERKKKKAMKKLKKATDPELCRQLREVIDKQVAPIKVKVVIIEMSACSYIDYGGLRILKQVIHEYNDCGIIVFIAACTASVKAILKRTDFYTLNDSSIVYISVHDAFTSARFQLKNGRLKEADHAEVDHKNSLQAITDNGQDAAAFADKSNDDGRKASVNSQRKPSAQLQEQGVVSAAFVNEENEEEA